MARCKHKEGRHRPEKTERQDHRNIDSDAKAVTEKHNE